MFEKCIKCEHLGKECMPNVCLLSLEEIQEWAFKLKAHKRITNAEISEQSGVPKGTVDMHFSRKKGHTSDVNYSTFAPILCTLTGCEEMQCPKNKLDGNAEESDKLKIEHLKNEINTMKKISADRMKIIIMMGILLGITLLLLIIALLIDKANPDLGFLWRNL